MHGSPGYRDNCLLFAGWLCYGPLVRAGGEARPVYETSVSIGADGTADNIALMVECAVGLNYRARTKLPRHLSTLVTSTVDPTLPVSTSDKKKHSPSLTAINIFPADLPSQR
jgi:hypothetical protein